MSERPTVTCLMMSSIDGRLHPSRYTKSPQGTVKDWSSVYEAMHDGLSAQAWLVGRVTMAEMAKGEPHPPSDHGQIKRPMHLARKDAGQYAISIDQSAKLHFKAPDIGGDHVVVILGSDVPDSHLAELAADGVSYLISPEAQIDLGWTLRMLRSELGIEHLLLEGGAAINGAFLAAGLVDELSVLVAPGLDGGIDVQGIVAHGEQGLAGKIQLSLIDCARKDHGLVHLRYRIEKA